MWYLGNIEVLCYISDYIIPKQLLLLLVCCVYLCVCVTKLWSFVLSSVCVCVWRLQLVSPCQRVGRVRKRLIDLTPSRTVLCMFCLCSIVYLLFEWRYCSEEYTLLPQCPPLCTVSCLHPYVTHQSCLLLGMEVTVWKKNRYLVGKGVAKQASMSVAVVVFWKHEPCIIFAAIFVACVW